MSHIVLNPRLIPSSTHADENTYNRSQSFGDKDGCDKHDEQESARTAEMSKKSNEQVGFDQEEFQNIKQRMGKMLAAHARQNDLIEDSQETVED